MKAQRIECEFKALSPVIFKICVSVSNRSGLEAQKNLAKEREREPGSRRSTLLQSIPLQSAQERRGQTLNVALERKSKVSHN
ncbi:unnamed protein product [Cylicocyclus nassatus]|uniref:Uncharacterized protein n=1 Tax=Cylicocyclus nassatus TaxID=53992 RepID=A0AA36GRN6_CYLNA|nr:unnamed protein product [Cylicocyclus nassatus]